MIANVLSHYVDLYFYFLDIVFCYHSVYFVVDACLCFWRHTQESGVQSQRLIPMFSPETVIVFPLTFRSLMYFQLSFVHNMI